MNKAKSEKEKTVFEIKAEIESLEKENVQRHCDLELLKIEVESWEKPLKDAHEVHKGILQQMVKIFFRGKILCICGLYCQYPDIFHGESGSASALNFQCVCFIVLYI